MAQLDPTRLSNPLWPTVVILTFGAFVGAAIGNFVMINGTYAWVVVNHPGTLFYVAPRLAPKLGAIANFTMVAIPLWAVLGGWWAASLAAGRTGSVGVDLGVMLLSEGHPVCRRVNELARELALPPIKWVGWFEDDAINAFAVGTRRDNALIAISRGAIEKLSNEQCDAVLAHELAHVANNDMARMTYARGVQEALTFFLLWRGFKNVARWLFTPISQLELMRFSRQREYWADAVAAVLTSPEAMIGALEAIHAAATKPPASQKAYAGFMIRGNDRNLFATHPPADERILALRSRKYIERLPVVGAAPTPASAPFLGS
ncbi:heat shock protein HtpX [Rhodobium orientis]|nr:M48 family metalloprotease [Rhodobium orientis]MBB4305538.1 heat shock protein HtpX [Rhodobium orientis]